MTKNDFPQLSPSERIRLEEDWNVDYWKTTLGIGRDELIAAVAAVGDRVQDVVEHVERERKSKAT